ncbi:MAG: hypothetical protein HY270_05510 [Deltaproteobacteria bacterium]|nr:hypothetical protein [Deltaproteobacteria bacterium]
MAQAKSAQAERKPVHEIRRGAVKACIWENAGENGTFFKFTVHKLYKQGDDWKTTASFGAGDVAKLSTVLLQVEDWINAQAKPAKKVA